MWEKRSQKGFHPGGGFHCGCALQQVVGTQHHQKNIHRRVIGEQAERIGIAWYFPAVGTGINAFVTCLLHQQVNPTIPGTITVTEETSGIVSVSIGISETQYPHRNHHLV